MHISKYNKKGRKKKRIFHVHSLPTLNRFRTSFRFVFLFFILIFIPSIMYKKSNTVPRSCGQSIYVSVYDHKILFTIYRYANLNNIFTFNSFSRFFLLFIQISIKKNLQCRADTPKTYILYTINKFIKKTAHTHTGGEQTKTKNWIN